jgi:hypothetical protein
MYQDFIKFNGVVDIVLRDESGNIKDSRHIENMVVTAGKDFISSRMIGTVKGVMSHMGLGDSSTAAATGQTDLQAASNKVRSNTSFTAVQSTVTTTNDTVTYSCVFPAGVATWGNTEAGLFNAGAAGDMLARTVFAVVNKGTNDSLSITWKITAA